MIRERRNSISMSSVGVNSQKDQMRMVEALQKIAEDNEGPQVKMTQQATPTRASFISDVGLLPMVDFGSSIDEADSNLAKCLTLGDSNQPECISYAASGGEAEHASLQVDENGSKVSMSPVLSNWMPRSVLLDVSHQSYTPLSPFLIDPTRRAVSYAPVSAAAFTAAMIMEPDSPVPKRPRSTPSTSVDGDYASGDFTGELSNEIEDMCSSDVSWEDSNGTLERLDLAQENFLCHVKEKCPPAQDPTSPVTPRTSSVEQVEPPAPKVKVERPCINHVRPRHEVHAISQVFALDVSTGKEERSTKLQPYSELSRDAALSKKRRAEAMERFRRKKAVRCYGRRVRYQIRKRIATTRPRVNGRFARKADVESLSSTSTNKS